MANTPVRYPTPVQKFWDQTSRELIAVWFGPQVFYATRKALAAPEKGHLTGYPDGLPTFESWRSNFQQPVGYAVDPAIGLRYLFFLNKDPYQFALAAIPATVEIGDQTVASTFELENWMVGLGLHEGDRMSAPSGGFMDSAFIKGLGKLAGGLLRRAEDSAPGQVAKTLKQVPGYVVWGGMRA